MAMTKHRRWNVLVSGLLVAVLAIIVTLTSRAAFLSPTAVVVVAAIGLVALLLQLRLRYGEMAGAVHAPGWLNTAGTLFALAALFGDQLHLSPGVSEVVALVAVGCFAVSGAVVLHDLRKQRALPK